MARVDFIDDNKSKDVARLATEAMAIPLTRREGVDIPAIVFRTNYTVPIHAQNTERSMPATRKTELATRGSEIWRLDCVQNSAVKQCFTSPTGLTLIYGPLGTGKTTTATVAAYEHCLINHRVIYTCVSVLSTDAALSSFLKVVQKAEAHMPKPPKSKSLAVADAPAQIGSLATRKPRKLCVVQFVGGLKTSALDMLDYDTTSSERTAAKANSEYLFHVQLHKKVQQWAVAEDHDMRSLADDYQTIVKKIQKTKDVPCGDTSTKLVVLQNQLVEHFLKEIDVVFTAWSSAPHPALQNFKPEVAFIDDAGQATLADTCMALSPFKESVK